MTCQQEGCAEPAALEVFWPGKTTRQCPSHAQRLIRLGAFMGFVVDVRPISAPDEAAP